MKRIIFWITLFVAAGLLLFALWLLRTRVPSSFPTTQQTSSEIGPLGAYVLYFGTRDGRGLVRETRFLPRSGDDERDMRTAIDALCDGTESNALSPWPGAAELKDVFVSPAGVAYLDFNSALRRGVPRGDFMEWLLVASLTRSICENFPALDGVRIMIEGESTGPFVATMPLDLTYRPAMFAEGG